jgi:hypothetical protein
MKGEKGEVEIKIGKLLSPSSFSLDHPHLLSNDDKLSTPKDIQVFVCFVFLFVLMFI